MDSALIGERVSQRKRRASLSTLNKSHNENREDDESPLHHFHGLCEDYDRVLDNTAVEYYDVINSNVWYSKPTICRQSVAR